MSSPSEMPRFVLKRAASSGVKPTISALIRQMESVTRTSLRYSKHAQVAAMKIRAAMRTDAVCRHDRSLTVRKIMISAHSALIAISVTPRMSQREGNNPIVLKAVGATAISHMIAAAPNGTKRNRSGRDNLLFGVDWEGYRMCLLLAQKLATFWRQESECSRVGGLAAAISLVRVQRRKCELSIGSESYQGGIKTPTLGCGLNLAD